MATGTGSHVRRTVSAAIAVLGACVATGIAAWLVPASVQVVSWPRGGAGRIAIFAPAFMLRWTLGGAGLAAVAIWFVGGARGEARRWRAHCVAPLAALWIWVIPFVPWLPDRFPVLLVLSGPLRWVVFAAAAAACLMRLASRARWTLPRLPAPGRKTVFICSLLFYVVVGFRSLEVIGIGGDEPHYLVITYSMLVDHDLQIENNHTRGDYRSFFGGPLRPDFMRRGLNGEIYSIHAPGLPALLLPAYAAAGVRGAVAAMCLFGALAALAIFDLGVLVGGVGAAWATWAGVCLTIPFIPHAWSIFPEMVGAAIVAWSMVWFAEEEPASAGQWLFRGVCLSVLPWLHTKFIVFLLALTLLLLIQARRRLRDAAALLAPIACSTVGWLAFFYVIYGTIDPQAPYGDYAGQFVRMSNVPRSLAGALFDQKFGLLVYAPVYLAAFAGAVLLLKDRRWRLLASSAILVAVLYVLSSARYYMWWGGSSAPARFLVPVVPLLAPMLAAAFARLRTGLVAVHVWAMLGVSLLISALGIVNMPQAMLFSNPHGAARIVEWLQDSAPLAAALPTFTEENWHAPLQRLGLWLVAVLATLFLMWFVRRRARGRADTSIFWPLVGEGLIFVTAAAIVSGAFPADVRADAVRRGRFTMMRRFDPDSLRAFDYRRPRMAKMTAVEWLDAGRLTFDIDPAQPPDEQGRLTDALSLPSGEYQLAVWFQDTLPRHGDLMVALGGGYTVARSEGPLQNPATVRFAMPIEVPRLWVQLSDPASAQAARRVEITPLSIVPVRARLKVQPRAVESISGRPNAYMAYVDDDAFPEGGVFWTRGTSPTEVLVAPAGARQILLTVHVGPVGGNVALDVAGTRHDISMQPEETRVLAVDVPPGMVAVPIRVQAPGAFRPADVDPRSSDTRTLGCQIRVEVGEGANGS